MDLSRVDIRLGYLCNSNCKFCCISDQGRDQTPTEEAKEKITLGRQDGAEKIVFTGGEPTIRKDIFSLVALAKKVGYKEILIITNGRMCSYPGFIDKLVKAGLTNLCFSIPHFKEDEYNDLTQTKNGYAQLQKALEHAKGHDLLISTISVLTKKNYKALENLAIYLSDLNKDFPNFFSELVMLNPTDNAWKYKDELLVSLTELAPYIHKALDIAKEKGLELNVEAVPFCYMKGYEKRVVELYMAKERLFLDPNKEENRRYNESRKVEGKVKNGNCKDCKFDDICEGIWKKYAEVYGDSELRYDYDLSPTLIQLTAACNHKCIFCTLDRHLVNEIPGFVEKPYRTNANLANGMSTQEAKEKIRFSNSNELTFIGGEPTLRSDLTELVSYAKSNKFKEITINSNGIRLADIEYVKELKSAGITFFLISFHSHKKEIFEKISGVKETFDKVTAGIKNAISEGLNVNLVCVISSLNQEDLLEYSKFVAKNLKGVRQINFVYIKPNMHKPESAKELTPRLNDVKRSLEEALDYCNEAGINYTLANIPPCILPNHIQANVQTSKLKEHSDRIIDEDGNAFDAWESERSKNNELDEYGFKSKRCKTCDLNDHCIGLLKEYAQIHGVDELIPLTKDKID